MSRYWLTLYEYTTMSRSRKRTPKTGYTTAESEKQDKRKANRAFGRITKVQLHTGKEPFTDPNAVSNVWLFDKDGKQYLKKATPKDMRK